MNTQYHFLAVNADRNVFPFQLMLVANSLSNDLANALRTNSILASNYSFTIDETVV